MKLLVIGTDTSILRDGSEAQLRIASYGRMFDELRIVIYTPRGFKSQTLSSGVGLYPTNSSFFFMRPWNAFRIGRRLVRERTLDLISVQDPAESGLAGWLLKKVTGRPLHIQLHADFFSPHFRKNSWKEWLRWRMARFVIPRGDKFRVVSERIRRSLLSAIRYLPRRSRGSGFLRGPLIPITVLPIFVDRAKIAETKPSFNLRQKYQQFDFIILMAARLVREKNIALALESFSELLGKFPKTGLIIVGDGPERKKLKVKSEKLKIAASVRFEGWQEDLVSYYKTADLCLLTSNFEGYSRAVVEAAAAGLPVVMTDVGVAGEIVRDGETGRVVPVGDKSALIRALFDARLGPTRSKEMAKKAQQLVLSLPPQKWEEYLKAYKSSFGF